MWTGSGSVIIGTYSAEWDRERDRESERGRMVALIIARRGPIWESLTAFLLTLPQIETVRLVDCSPLALEIAGECRPALVLVDGKLSNNGVLDVVRQIKGHEPPSPVLFLADDRQQQEDAAAAGADVAVIKGYLAAKLFGALEGLLSSDVQATRSRAQKAN